MANITPDFNQADGSGVPSPLTAKSGTFTTNRSRITTSGSNPFGAGWVASATSAFADGHVWGVFTANGSTSSSYGLEFRESDMSNLWLLVIDSTGLLRLYDRVAATFTTRVSHQIPDYDNTRFTDYRLDVVMLGNVITCFLDRVQVLQYTSSFNNTAVNHGFRMGDAGTHKVGKLELLDSDIFITTPNYTFKQHTSGSATATIDGYYFGTVTSIEYSTDGGSTWVVGDASPTGNAFSLSFALDVGQYEIQVRAANNTAINDTLPVYSVGDVIIWSGQSNPNRGYKNQQAARNRADVVPTMLTNADVFQPLKDPFNSNTSTNYDIISDDNARGSAIPEFATLLMQTSNTPICMVPCSEGGTTIEQWQKTNTETSGGLNRYDCITTKAALTGGCSKVMFQLGESDAEDLTVNSTFQTKLETLANDLNTDLGCGLFIVPLHQIDIPIYDGNGTTTGQIPIRAAQVSAAAANANIEIGQVTTGVDLSTGDKLHFQSTESLNELASLMYESFIDLYYKNNITLTATGITDGTYTVNLYDADKKTLIYTGDATFTSDTATISIVGDSTKRVDGYVDDGTATPTDGALLVASIA